MEENRIARFVGKSKPRRFAALLVFWIIFDRLFGYISHGIIGWPPHSWTQSIFYGAWMALWFTVLSIFGWQREIDV